MWILAIMNAIGLVSGLIINKTVMYALFGMSFVSFSHRYALVSWDLIYEQMVLEEGRMDTMFANEVVCFFAMACIYWMMANKAGPLCIVVSALQCTIFQVLNYAKRSTDNDSLIAVIFAVEFLISIVYLH